MTEIIDDVFITIVPHDEIGYQFSREALVNEKLPADDQVQFAGKAALESAVSFTKEGISAIVKVARKLLDADKIEEITIEYGDRKVKLRGIPADRAKTVEELTDHIFAQLRA